MSSVERRYSMEEFVSRGDSMYENVIRPQLKAGDNGKFAAIDIESGEFAVDADELKAGNKLRKRVPGAQIWMVRVGYASTRRFGGRQVRLELP